MRDEILAWAAIMTAMLKRDSLIAIVPRIANCQPPPVGRRSKTSTRVSKSARVTNSAISYVVRPPIGPGLPTRGQRGHLQATPL